MTYYIFKYKDTKDSEWLLGVNGGYEGDSLSDCGHTFSEMEPYDEKTAVKDATALVEMVRSYWMEQAKQAEEREKKADTFVGIRLALRQQLGQGKIHQRSERTVGHHR